MVIDMIKIEVNEEIEAEIATRIHNMLCEEYPNLPFGIERTD